MSDHPVVRAWFDSVKQWADWHSCSDLLDLIIVWSFYTQIKSNPAIKLVMILTTIRAINIPLFYISADYSPTDSYTKLVALGIGLEFGWYVFDHVNTISSFHRVLAFCNFKSEKIMATLFLMLSIGMGGVLRFFRSCCRVTTCMISSRGQLDSLIVVNNLVGEAIMIGFLIYRCIQYKAQTQNPIFDSFVEESKARIVILLPLGIAEALFYYLELLPETRNSVNWLLSIGTISRHFSGTMMCLTITLAKFKMQSMKTKGVNTSEKIVSVVPKSGTLNKSLMTK